MSVPLALITVTRMLSVQTLLVASPVPVIRDTLEMDLPVQVIHFNTVNKIDSPWPNCYNYTEIDECDIGTDNCDRNSVCTNTPGGFTCACNQGYTGDGLTCQGNKSFGFN